MALSAFFAKALNGLKPFRKFNALNPTTKASNPPATLLITLLSSLDMKFPTACAAILNHLTIVPSKVPNIFKLELVVNES